LFAVASTYADNAMTTVASNFASGWISEAWTIATSPIGYPVIFSVAIILIWMIIGWVFYLISMAKRGKRG
jgi:hypothetical protein